VNTHIDTAPVLEAFARGGECPLCDLRERTEEGYLELFLGGSVMEPDVRVVVNDKGFCARHFQMLYACGNRLGLALMAHTHLRETIRKFEERVNTAPDDRRPRWFGGHGARAPRPSHTARTHHAGDGDSRESCALCDRLDATMDRYIETTIYLWEHDSAFKARFNSSAGVCIPHFERLQRAARARGKRDFIEALIELERNNLNRVERELEWFTLKFDYRNKDKPWGDSKDALPRALRKLTGVNIKDE
jgi:hypothetical protein